MATPLKRMRSGYEDGYNVYLSQLRITIKRAFGVLVHRWAILRAPLCCPLPKVSSLVNALFRLNNSCINENDTAVTSVQSKTLISLTKSVRNSHKLGGADSELVEIGDDGRPTSLLGHGYHFADAPVDRRRDSCASQKTPMYYMLESAKKQGLTRPKY